MKFLCLPGAMTNAKSFKVVLAPVVKDLGSDDSITFVYTEGSVPAYLPPMFASYFGPAPHVRWMSFELPSGEPGSSRGFVDIIRDYPIEECAEDAMRGVTKQGMHLKQESLNDILEHLYRVMDEEGPFDGVLGYSEGSLVAATLLLDEKRRFLATGRPPQLKCAVFFNGWPPMISEQKGLLLADESPEVIDVFTCHILGSKDPWVQASVCLYNVCNKEKSYLFDHGGGHTVPRDLQTIHELGDVIRDMVKQVEAL